MVDSLESSEADVAADDELLSSIRSISAGALFHLVTFGVRNASGFLLVVLLTNGLGRELYGVYVYGKRFVTAALRFANLGTGLATTRYLSANHDDRTAQNEVLGFSVAVSLLVSGLIAVALFVAAPLVNSYTLGEPLLVPVLRAVALAVPLQALTRIAGFSFRGLEQPREQASVAVVGSVARLACIAGALLLGYSVLGAAVAYTLAGAVTLLVAGGLLFVRTDLRPSLTRSTEQVREWLDFSVPMTISHGGSFLYNRVDLFMVGIFLTADAVAVYDVALVVSTLITVPLSGFNQLFPPVASRLYANDDHRRLQTSFAVVTRWSVTASLLLALPVVLYPTRLLAVFGEEYTAGVAVLLLFVAGNLVNALSGPSNDLLTMTDNQYVVLVNHWGFGVLNVGLNYVFIQRFGVAGAAVATASVLAALNVVRVLEVWYLEGYVPYSRALWKPLVAGAVASLVMVATGALLSGYALLVGGSALGALSFGACLYLLGVEPEDRLLVEEYLDAR